MIVKELDVIFPWLTLRHIFNNTFLFIYFLTRTINCEQNHVNIFMTQAPVYYKY